MLHFSDNVHEYCTIAAIGGSRIKVTLRFIFLTKCSPKNGLTSENETSSSMYSQDGAIELLFHLDTASYYQFIYVCAISYCQRAKLISTCSTGNLVEVLQSLVTLFP